MASDRLDYQRRPITVDEVHRMSEAGFFDDATRRFDRNEKFPMYARHGVRETWLIDLVDRRVIVGREPLTAISFTVDELLGNAA